MQNTKCKRIYFNELYTPKTVIDGIYKTLSDMGFKQGNILEPSMGIGNFIGNIPDEMNKSKFYGIELDSVSGRIGKLLYPESEVQIKGLEETSFYNNFFDAVIGNIPFGEYKVNDREYNKITSLSMIISLRNPLIKSETAVLSPLSHQVEQWIKG